MDTVSKILSTLLSWPVVVLILALVFSKQLKRFFDVMLRGKASVKLPGNIEVSLKGLEEQTHPTPLVQEDKRFSEALSRVIAKLPDRSPESIRKTLDKVLSDHRKADLHLYLKTVSYQLLAWLFSHRAGEPFGIEDLLVTESIPIEHGRERVGEYCIHSVYEKEAVAAEFRRNYWNLKRYGVVEAVSDKQVRIASDSVVQEILLGSMEEVCRTEHERHSIKSFVRRFMEQPQVEAKKLEEGTLKRRGPEANKSAGGDA